ncbi:MAG TPA: DciA family protein [Pseudolysinimonas sp.]|nr:DciA family protein [Pseudolysinimonas sp.]
MSDRMPEPVPEHIAVWQRIRSVFGDPAVRSADARRRKRASRDETSVPYGTGRDPRGIGDVLGSLTAELGWDSPIAQAELVAKWPEIVGGNIAAHTSPVGFRDGELLVRCDSTPWATELRRMRATLTTTLLTMFPAAGLESVTIINPDAPSWKRGPRAIPGRGPRDTYG